MLCHLHSIAARWMLILCLGVFLSSFRAEARPYTQVYVFGGMYEDMGNNWDAAMRATTGGGYASGRQCNGPVYVEWLAKALRLLPLKISSEGGTNYAHASWNSRPDPTKQEKDLQQQIDEFEANLKGAGADPDALYVVSGFQGQAPDSAIVAMKRLGQLGAVYFLAIEIIEPALLIGWPGTVYNENSTGIDRIRGMSVGASSWNSLLADLASTARFNEGLNVAILSNRDLVTAVRLAGMVLNIETPPTGVDVNSYFNFIGWGPGGWGYSLPSSATHRILAEEIALEAINRRPTVAEKIEDLSLSIQDEPVSIDLSPVFDEPDGDRLTYTITVSVDSVLQATVDGFILTITPTADGFTKVTVVADDGIKQKTFDQFDVTVLSIPGTISLAAESADFGEIEIKTTATLSITISNTGEGPLTITDITSDISGVTPSETEFTVPVGESHDLTLTFRATTEGEIAGTLTIISNDAENGTINVSLSGAAIVIPADPRTDFNGDGQLNLTDFILFAQNYGSSNPDFDLSGNGRVDLADFILFVQNYTRRLQ